MIKMDDEKKLELYGNPKTVWYNKYIVNSAKENLRNKKPVSEVVPQKSESKSATKDELYALTKSEQIDLLLTLGAGKIPRYEKGRVAKILELQG